MTLTVDSVPVAPVIRIRRSSPSTKPAVFHILQQVRVALVGERTGVAEADLRTSGARGNRRCRRERRRHPTLSIAVAAVPVWITSSAQLMSVNRYRWRRF